MEVAPDRHLTVTDDHSLDEPPMKRRSCRRRACRRLAQLRRPACSAQREPRGTDQARPCAGHAQATTGPQRVDRVAGTGPGRAPPASRAVCTGNRFNHPDVGVGWRAEGGVVRDGVRRTVPTRWRAVLPGTPALFCDPPTQRERVQPRTPGPNVTVRSVNDVGIRNIPVITCDGATPAAAFTRPKSSPHIRAGHAFGEFDAIECREIC